MNLTPTLLIWHRFGKEHGEGEFRVNPPEVVAQHLQNRATLFRGSTTPDDWRWFQVDDTLIVERPAPDDVIFGPDTRIFYLLDQGISILEDIRYPRTDRWRWYIHLADYAFNPDLDCWVMQDLFVDVFVTPDERTNQVLDLDDLALALDLSLITPAKTSEILRRTETLIWQIARGEFPFEAV
ncbi:MAG: hypothetical protein HUU38_01495, partial [Anaerolineales bacterium]|nr:hypothetical protein [Anaerolineales bacterium]